MSHHTFWPFPLDYLRSCRNFKFAIISFIENNSPYHFLPLPNQCSTTERRELILIYNPLNVLIQARASLLSLCRDPQMPPDVLCHASSPSLPFTNMNNLTQCSNVSRIGDPNGKRYCTDMLIYIQIDPLSLSSTSSWWSRFTVISP